MQIEIPSDASYKEFSDALEDLLSSGDGRGAAALCETFSYHYEAWRLFAISQGFRCSYWNERDGFLYDYDEDGE